MGQRTKIKFSRVAMTWQTIIKENNLDASVINLSKLQGKMRLDAEYYRPVFLQASNLCKEKENAVLGGLIDLLTDYHANGAYETLRDNVQMSDTPDYALMIRTTDLQNDNYDNDVKYISENAYNFLKKSQVFGGEIIINKIGSAGKPYLMPFLNREVSLGMNQFLLKVNNKKVDNFYLYAYLVSSFGSSLINQKVTGAVPLSIDKQSVRDVIVPLPSQAFQQHIHSLIERHQNLKQASAKEYKGVGLSFLKEINLIDYKASNENISIRNFKDCLSDNRFDAEYWQPKYDEMTKRVSSIPQKELGDIVSMQKGIDPGSEAYTEDGKSFVRVSDISIYGIENGDKKISDELYEELKENYKPQKGEVLFTKDGTIGISFALHEDIDAVISGAFLRLKPKIKINNDYLALVLNSLYCKFQIERMSGGAIIAHLKPENVKKIKVPLLSDSKQKELAEKAINSLRLRNEAKELLEKAKRAVEIFIEKDEQEALKHLTSL